MKNIVIFAAMLIPILWGCEKQKTMTEKNHPEWSKNASIYELNTRQFTEEGTFNAAYEHLPRLQELGVKILWIMPIHEIGVLERKGSLGSYYAIKDYKSINHEFGTLDDFKRLVDSAHELDMKVIIDWVANHTSPDAAWTIDHKDWYVLDDNGDFIVQYDWTDIAKLDYTNQQMRDAMVESMIYWLNEANIDGFRCDVAYEVPTEFWNYAIGKLTAVRPDIFMLAEAELPELNEKAFDAYYAWEMHHLMNDIAQGKEPLSALRKQIARQDERFPKHAIPMNFTSNHDENSWNGTEFERMGDAVKTFAVLKYIIPGMPLIYNGQEVGQDKRINFFEKDTIRWDDNGGFTKHYTVLNKLKRSNKALWNAQWGGELKMLHNDHNEKVFSCVREKDGDKVVAIMNLTDKSAKVEIDTESWAGNYTDVFTGEAVTLEAKHRMELAPWEYLICQ